MKFEIIAPGSYETTEHRFYWKLHLQGVVFPVVICRGDICYHDRNCVAEITDNDETDLSTDT